MKEMWITISEVSPIISTMEYWKSGGLKIENKLVYRYMYMSKSMQIGNIFKNSSSSNHSSKGRFLKLFSGLAKKNRYQMCSVDSLYPNQTKKRNLYVDCVELVD